MAILRALDGTFYEIPDDQVERYKIPEDQVKAKLGAQAPTEGGGPPEGPPESGGPGSPLVNVQIYYTGQGGAPPTGTEAAVQPYDWHNWRNWRNWRNWYNWHNWRNHWD